MSDKTAFERRYRISRTRLKQGYLLGAMLGFIGVVIYFVGRSVIPDATLIAVAHIVAAGVILGFNLHLARDPSPRLVLDEDGVWYRDWKTRPIPWKQIHGIAAAGSRFNSYIAVEIRDIDTLMHIIPAADRQNFRSNRLVNLPRLFIPNNTVDARFEDLLAALRAGLETYG